MAKAKAKAKAKAQRPARSPARVRPECVRPFSTRALLAAKRRIERELRVHVQLRHDHGAMHCNEHLDAEFRNLVGIAIGQSRAAEGVVHREGAAPGDAVLLVMLAKKRSQAAVRELLKRLLRTKPGAVSVPPFEVLVIGKVQAHAQTFSLRPATPGTSVSNCGTESGTFGFLARGRTGPRRNQLFVVSNTHVLARVGGQPVVKGVSQPGRTDGGSCPAAQIATLEKFIPVRPGAQNRVDAATALVSSPTVVRADLLFMQGGTRKFMKIGAQPVAATIGMPVGKSGRQTELTNGSVISVASTVIATFGTVTALFVDQILVRGVAGRFSDFGDSGSLVFALDAQRSPVGLLFGGSANVSFVNHIDEVLDELDVDMVV